MKIGIDYIGVTVSFFCHDGKGNFLLHKRSKNCRDEQGNWDFGGGQLEYGEDLVSGVLREIQEEYGVKGSIDEQLPALSVVRQLNGKKTHWVSIGFIVTVDPKKAKLNEPKSMDEIGWFTFNNLPQPLHTSLANRFVKQKHLFKKYIK